jgi:nicotinate-nucleotide adenylyltransferase
MTKNAAARRIAFYGGTFDPVHTGHIAVARSVTNLFGLDEFALLPAFQAPHKKDRLPTAAIHRHAMLVLATQADPRIKVSTLEIEAPERPYTVETQRTVIDTHSGAEIFFVIGADSWNEIGTWRDWQEVLSITNIIVAARPGSDLNFGHVGKEFLARIQDLRNCSTKSIFAEVNGLPAEGRSPEDAQKKIYLTDAVQINVSSSDIRTRIRRSDIEWPSMVPPEVAAYIEKYALYLK